MTSSKSVGFIFLALTLLPFVASSQTFPKIQVIIPLTVGAPPSILYANTTEGGGVDREKPEPLMGSRTERENQAGPGRRQDRTGDVAREIEQAPVEFIYCSARVAFKAIAREDS